MGMKKVLLKFDIFYIFYNALKGCHKKIKGENNSIITTKVMFNNVKISINGNNNKVIIKKGARFYNCKISILGNGHTLILGAGCIIKKTLFWFEGLNCSIEVGKDTTIEGADIAAVENTKIKIGDDCMFSQGIYISTTDSHSIIDIDSSERINKDEDVNIGNHVWLGANCKILKGVNISNNAVVGVASIVTKDVPGNCIVAGVPAKIIKENINWLRDRI